MLSILAHYLVFYISVYRLAGGAEEEDRAGSVVRQEGTVSADGQVAGTIHQFRGDRQGSGRGFENLVIYLISTDGIRPGG
jgi:hypothetical protein